MEACKKICDACPFAKGALPGWLGPYESPEELHALVMSELPFPCHKTMDRDLDNHEAGTHRYPICAGSLAYMRKSGKSPRGKEMRELVYAVPQEQMDEVMDLVEFVKHHSDES